MARRLEAASQYSVIASNWEGRCLARDVHHWAYSRQEADHRDRDLAMGRP